ncbi:unnamed protein product [Miscanthus lutarioriparius]|uniref:Zinc knuckle CX2CX4HX4C domain-containing protein n=1 Tax=Miscanthus lutarioriparius TaxID=422564 RepID=A0A811PNL9_9POAL|nr:unnamed protein product [Miscanthus lutarioriparius]
MEVDELLKMLQLSEEEKDGVVLAKEDRENLPAVKWMAAAKLLTAKEFSVTSLVSTMRSAWNPAREVTFRSIGKNLLVVQAFCLGDWKRIMEDGPWIFRGYALMLEELDGSTIIPSEMPRCLVGEVQEIEMKAIASRTGDFHRVRVKLAAAKPLIRVVTLAPEGQVKILLQVKYEKLPRFCAHCGLMGHVHLECGAREYTEKDLQFGSWMVADAESWHPGTPRFRSLAPGDREMPRDGGGRGGVKPTRGGRGQVGGRGGRGPMWKAKATTTSESSSRKRTSADVGDDNKDDKELDDMASSPAKTAAQAGVGEEPPTPHPPTPPPPEYKSPREIKRAKRTEEKKATSAKDIDGAGSLEECRHPQ